ncbi:hypothetical protein ABZ858_33155 [Streptomyces sp. NPDC047017]|uniref:hypothetical protein n=1 Tax=Streptomyces sp. NPDC047017 TaxID=3155024 RepID=UPI0033C396D2
MPRDDSRPGAGHPTWWRAPLVATLLGLPFLVAEYRWFASQDGPGAFGGVLYWATGLLALAWLLPHRRPARTPRMLSAGAGLGCALLPGLMAMLLMGAAAASH